MWGLRGRTDHEFDVHRRGIAEALLDVLLTVFIDYRYCYFIPVPVFTDYCYYYFIPVPVFITVPGLIDYR